MSTKYVSVKKHTHNKNEKAMEIMFCKCNEESIYLHWTELNWISLFQVDINNKIHLLFCPSTRAEWTREALLIGSFLTRIFKNFVGISVISNDL